MKEYEYKIELINYLNVLGKRKWIIIITTLLFIAGSSIISFLLPSKWEVNAIIEPSKFLTPSAGGRLNSNFFYDPKDIANFANNGGYNNSIASHAKLDFQDLPTLNAENPTNSNLVRFSIIERNIEKAKLILHSLLNYLKQSLDRMADIEIEEISSIIKSKEFEKLMIDDEIKISKKKIDIIKQRKQEIEKEMTNIRKTIEELKEKRRFIINKKNLSESENLEILLYSNEIQQSSTNLIVLNELYGDKIIEEGNINLELKDREREKYLIENEISNMIERKGRIHYAQIIKEPTSSSSPVSPNRLFNILIAIPLGLLISIILAFFLEYIEKIKAQSRG
ncbi:MAG: Wzz/FepE/Etk N-terminal domain-containing protein [Candidatus Hodarchaeota archaeon]